MDYKNAGELMKEAVQTYEQRGKEYGPSYHRFGEIMTALFPEGLAVMSVAEWNRLGVLVQIVGKLARYAPSFLKGGHRDSIHDIGVYAFMLEELDQKYAGEPFPFGHNVVDPVKCGCDRCEKDGGSE